MGTLGIVMKIKLLFAIVDVKIFGIKNLKFAKNSKISKREKMQ